MNFPDIWATITGVAGIISLFLALNEKYANWKKFTLPICIGLVGFCYRSIYHYNYSNCRSFLIKKSYHNGCGLFSTIGSLGSLLYWDAIRTARVRVCQYVRFTYNCP
jgi:hypothetical protein